MALQSYTAIVGNLVDDSSGSNYGKYTPVYVKRLDGTNAAIFEDFDGNTPIVQDGIQNISNQKGEFTFFVEAGDYNINVGSGDVRVSIAGADYFNNKIEDLNRLFKATSIYTVDVPSIVDGLIVLPFDIPDPLVIIDGRILPDDGTFYTVSVDNTEIQLNVLVEPDSNVEIRYSNIIDTGVIDGAGSIPLSSFATATENKVNQAWTKLVSSGINGSTVVIDDNPFTTDGRWYADEPCSIPNGTTINFNQLVEWNNTDEAKNYRRSRGMFEGIGTLSATVSTSVTANISEDDDMITVASTTGFSVGDFVSIELVVSGDNSAGYFPQLYWVSQIVGIDGSDLYLDVKIPWPVNVSGSTFTTNTVTLIEEVARDITINNARFLDTSPFVTHADPVGTSQPNYVIGPLFFKYCHNIEINNVTGNRMKCPLVQFREFNDCRVNGLRILNPDTIGPGEGYGVQWSRGVYATGNALIACNERHVFDFTRSWYNNINGAASPKTRGTATFLQHGGFEAHTTIRNAYGDSWSFGAGFEFGNWSKGLIHEDCRFGEVLVGGRGTLSWDAKTCEIGDIDGRFYCDRLSFESVRAPTTFLEVRKETRVDLSADIERPLDAGAVFEGATIFSGGEILGLPAVTLEDGTKQRYGGTLQRRLLFLDCPDVSIGKVSVSRIEFEHRGEAGRITYTGGLDMDLDFPEYDGFGQAGVFIRSLDLASGYDECIVSMGLTNIRQTVGATNAKPIRIQRGTGTLEQIKVKLAGIQPENGNGSIFLEEKTGAEPFTISGNISNCVFNNRSVEFLIDDVTQTPIPQRLIVNGNTYLGSADKVDNYGGSVFSESGVNLTFSANPIPAGGETRALISPSTFTLQPTDAVYVNINNLPVGVSSSTYYDNATVPAGYKVKVVNATGADVSFASALCNVMVVRPIVS